MRETTKAKVMLLIKVYLKYIKKDGATAKEIYYFLNFDNWGLPGITTSQIAGVIQQKYYRNNDYMLHVVCERPHDGKECKYKWVEDI